MIVGNLTWAIVILMELHGKAYRFTAGERESKKRWVGRCSEKVNYPTQLDLNSFPLWEGRNMGSRMGISKA